MNAMDSTAILEAIHQGGLAKRGHKSPARETKQGCAIRKRVWKVT